MMFQEPEFEDYVVWECDPALVPESILNEAEYLFNNWQHYLCFEVIYINETKVLVTEDRYEIQIKLSDPCEYTVTIQLEGVSFRSDPTPRGSVYNVLQAVELTLNLVE